MLDINGAVLSKAVASTSFYMIELLRQTIKNKLINKNVLKVRPRCVILFYSSKSEIITIPFNYFMLIQM